MPGGGSGGCGTGRSAGRGRLGDAVLRGRVAGGLTLLHELPQLAREGVQLALHLTDDFFLEGQNVAGG